MAIRFVRAAAAAIVLSGLALAPARAAAEPDPNDALPDVAPPMAVGQRAMKPVAAWSVLCRDLPDECAVDPSEPERITLDPGTWRLIRDVNDGVNAAVIPMTDMDHWGVVDVWGYPVDGRGDCEDYQLQKRKVLASLGVPRRAMRMTVVVDELGEGHAVLTVLTDRGDLVLDNKSAVNGASPVLHAADTGYTFIKREGSVPGPDGGPWVALGPDLDPPGIVASAQPR